MLKFLLFIVIYIVNVCSSSNILVVFSVPEKRHGILGDSLVKSLLEDGHEVTYVTPFPREARVYNLEYVDIRSREHKSEDDGFDTQYTSNNSIQMEYLGSRYAKRALQHPNMQELMMNTSRSFDLVVAEWFYTGLLAPLSSLFECPLVWYSPTGVSWKPLSLVNSDVSTFPAPPPGSSIAERVQRLWAQLTFVVRNHYHISSVKLPAYEKSYRNAFQVRKEILPNYEALVYNSSLLLINSNQLLSETSALPSNAKYVGGHHIDADIPPLPKNLKKLMDESKDGVVYIDLESDLISKDVQENVIQELMDAFGQIKQTVIWKYDEILVNLPKNVYTIKKPPQQGILNHANTVAFVNHGDMTSVIEAAHSGVPTIGVPVMEDQIENIDSVVKRELGLKVEVDNELSKNIRNAIDALVDDKSYRAKAKEARSILQYRLTSPQKEFQHWIRMVINTHGARHLRSPSLQISTLERYNLDILLLLLMLLWFLTKVIKVVQVHSDNPSEDLDKKDS